MKRLAIALLLASMFYVGCEDNTKKKTGTPPPPAPAADKDKATK
ncbi:MAG: hypothetical protein ABSG68_17990 [Thermoguttaceae bacterium]|jgi:hypothetical protein